MAINWRTLCGRASGFEFEGDDVLVAFENERRHRVRVEETVDAFELRAFVARAAAVRDVPDLPLRIWRRNREAQLVSFLLDSRGRVVACGWIAKTGITAEEFQLVLRRVAAEADRFEFLLTGSDAE